MDGNLQCSVVMSAYNAEKTIEKSIGSLLSQSYPHIEVIVVNDCSSDKTEEIVKAIAKRDSRVKIFSNEVNLGPGLTRRRAIENMTGECMTFLDHDDLLKPDCIETLVREMESNDVDVVAPGLVIVDQEMNVLQTKTPDRRLLVGGAKFKKNPQDTMRFMNPMLIRSHIWNKAEYSSRRVIEDTQTLIQVLYYAKSVLTIDYAGYYYVQDPKSLSHGTVGAKRLVATALCAKDIMEFFKGKDDRLSGPRGFLMCCDNLFKNITEEDERIWEKELKEIRECMNYIKQEGGKIWLN